MNQKLILVFGYSDNPERYSHLAYKLLKQHEHEVVTFNPRSDAADHLPHQLDTITFYVNPSVQEKFENIILSLNFKRAIFNPGTENPELEKKLSIRGVEVVRGCTLVMLKTDQF